MSKIRELNDRFRQTFVGGAIEATRGFQALPSEAKRELLARIRKDNDGSFGAVALNGHRVFWRIDTLDRECEHESSDPSDPAVTTRILAIMTTEELKQAL